MLRLAVIAFVCTLGVATVQAAMTDPTTGIAFVPKVNDLDIVGVGVRKKGPIGVDATARATCFASSTDFSNMFSQC